MSEMIEDLTEWFYKFPVKDVISYELIGQQIKKLRGAGGVTQYDVASAVTSCRKELELRKKTTLINIRGVGYKLATPREVALYAARSASRTIRWADRTYRVMEITDRHLLPAAIRTVFPEKNIRTLSRAGQKFVTGLVEFTKSQQRKEISDETKTRPRKKDNGKRKKS